MNKKTITPILLISILLISSLGCINFRNDVNIIDGDETFSITQDERFKYKKYTTNNGNIIDLIGLKIVGGEINYNINQISKNTDGRIIVNYGFRTLSTDLDIYDTTKNIDVINSPRQEVIEQTELMYVGEVTLDDGIKRPTFQVQLKYIVYTQYPGDLYEPYVV